MSSVAGLKQSVLQANLDIVRDKLVVATFGNASGIDRNNNHIVIKPSGVSFETMKSEDMVTVHIDGSLIDHHLRPSSDLDTHLVLYRAFDDIGGVIHTHSTYATIFAQAQVPIPCFGTTHADYFRGEIPVTRSLRSEELGERYVTATGEAIVETFSNSDPLEIPAVLVAGHGPFVWGRTPKEAALNALILEECARMAWHTMQLNPQVAPISSMYRDRHFLRKHGAHATYGQ
ncbi:L-ribulose-5-phosphate 4-epimerase AraD [Carnimonas nigrificans]|uniref:L-ribulose-5-phosphate 4-epimerase AraD n=1 Tax=Carnimonas nigrificans TaxID=64323 RepID=UPI00046FE3C9|nr:L-ribulose-5-phosphate 4-epimerase AraD [Carnimonas nigrificans]